MNNNLDFSARKAIVLGGSGSVGKAVLQELFSQNFSVVISLGRRPINDVQAVPSSCKFIEKLVPDMTPETLYKATLEILQNTEGTFEAFSVLGVGADTAKLTLEEHRAIDVYLNEAFARGLKDSAKINHLAFMSAVGANPKAKASGNGAAGMPRYSRVKGESEEAVRASGPKVVSVFRPSMIIGSIHTPSLLAKILPLFSFITPSKFKSITTQQIARAMLAVSKDEPSESRTYHYSEMMEFISKG